MAIMSWNNIPIRFKTALIASGTYLVYHILFVFLSSTSFFDGSLISFFSLPGFLVVSSIFPSCMLSGVNTSDWCPEDISNSLLPIIIINLIIYSVFGFIMGLLIEKSK
jgi:hypothetical protein